MSNPTMADRPDQDLLDLILNSNATVDEKARAVLTVREHGALKKQNRYLLAITMVASLAALIQAFPIFMRYINPSAEAKPPSICECQNQHPASAGTASSNTDSKHKGGK